MRQQNIEKKLIIWNKKYGGLSIETQRKLDKLVSMYEKSQSLPEGALNNGFAIVMRSLKNFKTSFKISSLTYNKLKNSGISAGARFIREFKGRKHEVTTLEQGFEYKGKEYKSLSAIANKITGTHWNGKKFFGLREPAAKAKPVRF